MTSYDIINTTEDLQTYGLVVDTKFCNKEEQYKMTCFGIYTYLSTTIIRKLMKDYRYSRRKINHELVEYGIRTKVGTRNKVIRDTIRQKK